MLCELNLFLHNMFRIPKSKLRECEDGLEDSVKVCRTEVYGRSLG